MYLKLLSKYMYFTLKNMSDMVTCVFKLKVMVKNMTQCIEKVYKTKVFQHFEHSFLILKV